jgi:hypothetical protein
MEDTKVEVAAEKQIDETDDKQAGQNVVAEYAASVLRVERIGQ